MLDVDEILLKHDKELAQKTSFGQIILISDPKEIEEERIRILMTNEMDDFFTVYKNPNS